MLNTDFIKFNSEENTENRVAVVFVHGFSGDLRQTWGEIPKLLKDSNTLLGWDFFGFGYSSKKRFDLLGLWSADPDLERIAEKLITTLEIEAKDYKLAFVAHSMGGLAVQRALILNAAMRERTTHVILFGTPSDGLIKAGRVSWFKQQANDMAAGGKFVKSLRADWQSKGFDTGRPFRFLTVAGEMDQFVDPHSSLDPFPKDVQRVISGNHLTMLDAKSTSAPCIQIILESLNFGAAHSGLRSSANVAVDSGNFQEAINRLWPNREGLDDKGATQLAIALDRTVRRDEAIALLRARKPAGTDVLGVLAGRLKRRWLINSSAEDFKSAMELYQQGYSQAVDNVPPDYDQAYYHGINVAYLLLAGDKRDVLGAKRMAQHVLDHCPNCVSSYWRLASEGDALMILGRFSEGFQKHREALGADPSPSAWEVLSIEEQALRVAELSGVSKKEGEKLAAIYEGS